MRASASIGAIAAAVVVLILASPLCAAQATAVDAMELFRYGKNENSDEHWTNLYLKWDEASQKGRLDTDPLAATDDPGGMGRTGAVDPRLAQAYASHSAGQPADIVDEFVSAPLAAPLYLNASKTIHVDLFRQCTFGSTTGSYIPRFDVVVFQEIGGAKKILAGQLDSQIVPVWAETFTAGHPYYRPDYPHRPANALGYCIHPFRLPLEADKVPAGTVIRLRITQYSEYAFVPPAAFGMRDHAQSLVSFPSYTPEELVYRFPEFIEDPAAAFAQPTSTTSGSAMGMGKSMDPSPTSWLPTLAAASGVAGLSLPLSHRKGRAWVLVLFFVSMAFAGCFGAGGHSSGATPTGPSAPTNGVTSKNLIRDPGTGLTGAGDGTIYGRVHDELHSPVDHAFAALARTDNFTETDKYGGFFLYHIAPGTYSLHVDHEGYRSSIGDVEVRAGFLTPVDVVLPMIDATSLDGRAHVHDYWTAATETIVQSMPIHWRFASSLSGFVPTSVAGDRRACTNNDGPYQGTAPAGGTFSQSAYRYCVEDIVLRPGPGVDWPTIKPGTSQVDLIVDWKKSSSNTVPAAGVAVLTNQKALEITPFLPRGPGEPTTIATTWEMADVGHQRATTWGFEVFIPVPPGVSYAMDDTFTLTMRIHKGVVPLEPAHVDPWHGKNSLILKNSIEGCFLSYMPGCDPENVEQYPTCDAQSYSHYGQRPYRCAVYAPANGLGYVPILRKPVPLDARWLDITLSQSSGDRKLPWFLEFKTGNDPVWPKEPKIALPEGPGTDSSTTPSSRWIPFKVCLGEKETDTPYQVRTLWDMVVRYSGTEPYTEVGTSHEPTPGEPDWASSFAFRVIAHKDAPPPGVCT